MPTIRIAGAGGKNAELTPTEADADMLRTPAAKASNYSPTAAHNREIHELGGTVATVTLPTVSNSFSETDDWRVTLVNTLSTAVTVARNSQTIDGENSDYTLRPYETRTFWMNSTFDGFLTDAPEATKLRGVRALLTSAVSHATSSTWQVIAFNSESYDTESAYDTETGLLTVPSWATHFRVVASVRFSANATGFRQIGLSTTNNAAGANIFEMGPTSSGITVYATMANCTTGWIPAVPSFYVMAWQTSGGALNMETFSRLYVEFL